MVAVKLLICNVVVWLLTLSTLLIRAEKISNNSSSIELNDNKSLSIIPGIKCFLLNNEIIIRIKIHDLLKETQVQSRKSQEKRNPLHRFGFMMLMTPFIMQILSLPAAIGSIKMTLLRNIMVAQLAIALMIYNLIKSARSTEVVVVHQPHQHHAHYYHNNYYRPEDENDGWFGR